MVLIDYSNLIHRLLWVCIKESHPRKKDKKYITSEYENMFRHYIFNNIRFILKRYKNESVVICTDANKNWRKDFYPQYKEHRKKDREESLVDYEDVYKIIDESVRVLDEYFPVKILGVDGAEADDIIAVLTKSFHAQETITIISEDKDFKQLLKHNNVKLYKPIKREFETVTEKQLKEWEMEHIVMGDKSDNVPRIVDDTEFTNDFWKYLSLNDIVVDDVSQFNKLNIRNKLMEDFMQDHPEKNVFKLIRFGPVALKKFLKEFDLNMKSNPLYKENYARNEILVLFDNIPSAITDSILNEYKNSSVSFSYIGMQDYFSEHSLIELYENVQDFLIYSLSNKTETLDDW